eukprot:Skav220370  [mRNA]  locus=scaffold609:169744:170821:+ [translate_table: standard]
MWILLLTGTFLDSPSVRATSGWLAAIFLVFIFLSHMMVLNMLIGILCDVVHQAGAGSIELLTYSNPIRWYPHKTVHSLHTAYAVWMRI